MSNYLVSRFRDASDNMLARDSKQQNSINMLGYKKNKFEALTTDF